ncbi:MAG: ribonuclease Y [Elusimicrobia bacterium]|nr:ribonuclease Y [Elusimicrobiota bacterium]
MIFLYIASGIIAGFVIRSIFAGKSRKDEVGELKEKMARLSDEMRQKLENKEKEVSEEKKKINEDFRKSTAQTRDEIKKMKEEIETKSKTIERKADVLEKKEIEIKGKEDNLESIRSKFEEKEKFVNEILQKENTMLEKISGMSPKEAREELMSRVEEEAKEDAQKNYKQIVDNAKRDAQRESIEILAQAIQRNASEVTQESTVSTVSLTDDDMKGRIIGREGRNIRTLEAETGVNIIIDDTPGVITISSFDGVRREVAKRSLEFLIKDGRIQPVRIEEVVQKIQKEVDDIVRKAGESAVMDAGVTGLHDEMVTLLGRLKFRTSYGQNVLAHSIEVAHFAGIMAEELEIDAAFARRAGLLHDIGKAVDKDMDGNHVTIGAKLVKRYGESERLQNAIMAHHEDEQAQTAEAILIIAADTISASRPGARRENIEYYVKRITEVEEIAKGFEGVKEAYCISAGREIRIIVEPNKVSDLDAANIAKSCAKSIEEKIDYPGEIKVTVIRSSKNVEVAK